MPAYDEYGLFNGEESFAFVQEEVEPYSMPEMTENIAITLSDMMFKLSIVPPPEMIDLHQKSLSIGWDRQRIQSDMDSLTPLFEDLTLGTVMLVHVHQETNKSGCPRIPAYMERKFCDLEINRLARMLLRLDGMKARTLTVSPSDIFSTQSNCVPLPNEDGAGSLVADEDIFPIATTSSSNGLFDADIQNFQYNDYSQSLSLYQSTVPSDAQAHLQPMQLSMSPLLPWTELSPPSTPGWSSSGSGSSFAPSPPASSTSEYVDSGSMSAPSPPSAISVREASVPLPNTLSATVIVTARQARSKPATRSHSPAPPRPQASGTQRRKAVITVTAVPLAAAISITQKRSPPATTPQSKASRKRRSSSQVEAQIQVVDDAPVAAEEDADDEDAEYELDEEFSAPAPGPVRNARTTGRSTGDWAPRRRSRKCECEFPECRAQKMSFSRAHDLKRHLQTVHGHTKIFHCTLCHPGTTQAVLDQFAAAWRKMSKDEKMGYFTRKDAHRRHMANVHSMKI